jgi:hypothetical protein
MMIHFDSSVYKGLHQSEAGKDFEANRFAKQNDDTQFRCHEFRINAASQLFSFSFYKIALPLIMRHKTISI